MRTPRIAFLAITISLFTAPAVIAQPPVRLTILCGGNLNMPVGDLAATEPTHGAYAITDLGFSLQCCYAFSETFSLLARYDRPHFGFDSEGFRDHTGRNIEDPGQQFTIIGGGLRLSLPSEKDYLPYLQFCAGRYTYETEGYEGGVPTGIKAGPALGFSAGAGITAYFGWLGLELTMEVHGANLDLPTGIELRTRWLLMSALFAVPLG